jgi:hypothetical protein
MIIKSANVYHINEAAHGGYDTIEHRITTDNDEELTFVYCPAEPYYTLIIMSVGDMLYTDEFPTHNINRRLFKTLWALFRSRVRDEGV